MKFARVIGRINSAVILSLLFIFIVGSYALAVRLRNLLKGKKSYQKSFWLEKKYTEPSLENLSKPF